nr:transposase, MuDR, MULE transposase domain protein [Tanacetum cinerariifolium]
MRPLLITDGAHLKGTYKGINLVLVRMDGNNQIVPIATGVSQGETGESWTWFLLNFKECIGEVLNLAIITDRHPAIILACNMIFSNAFHGKTTLYSTYQDLVYLVGEPSSWVRPDGLQVVKPPNINFHTVDRPENTDRIKSQGEEPIQVRCSRCGTTERHAMNQLQIIKT